MNTYRHQFVVSCPANKQPIIYQFEVQSPKMIYVEHIVMACQMWAQEYHEKMADSLATQFPGTHQVLRAHHHGVDVETHRQINKPESKPDDKDWDAVAKNYSGISG